MQPPKPPLDFTPNIDKLTKPEPIRIDPKFAESLVWIGRAFAHMQINLGKIVQPWMTNFAEIFKDRAKAEAVQAAGWIPHPTTPLDRIEPDTSAYEIEAILIAHYRDNWPQVRDALSKSIAATAIDAEAKATFEEALAAHEAGFYRSVVRLLFPEIERIARETIYAGSRQDTRGKRPKNNAGLSDFREALMSDLPVGILLDMPFSFSLLEKLCEHLYKYVPEDKAGLAIFEHDPVPNRHASQHGYVIYSSAQNSINMLAMTDFIFHVILRTKAYLEQCTEEAQTGEEAQPTPKS